MMDKIKKVVYIVALFMAPLFMALYALLTGTVWGGNETGNLYVLYILILDGLVVLYYIGTLNRRKFRLPRAEVVVILLLLVILVVYALGDCQYGTMRKYIEQYCCFVVPSTLIGLEYSRSKSLGSIASVMQVVMLVITMGVVVMEILEKVKPTVKYQAISYYCGLAYTINLVCVLFRDKLNLMPFLNFRGSRIMYVSLLALQVVVSLASGGRGGFVLIIFSSIVLMGLYMNRISRRKIVLLLGVLLGLCIFWWAIPSEIKDYVFRGSQRTFSYLTTSGVDMSQTSDRDVFYHEAVLLIKKRPWLGYGLWNYLNYTGGNYPHNIVLEILLQGGLIYLIFWMIVMLEVLKKYRVMLKNDPNNLLLLPFILYAITRLCFSSTYLVEGFWGFAVSYIFAYEFSYNDG